MPRRSTATLAALTLLIAMPAVAAAAAPENDVHPGIVITALPFTHTVDTTEAQIHAMEMSATCFVGGTASVWYSFTPDADISVVADTFGSDYDTVLDVRTGTLTDDFFDPGFQSLTTVACNDDTDGQQSRVSFTASAGTRYLIRVLGAEGGGALTFNLAAAATMPNAAVARPTAGGQGPELWLGVLALAGAGLIGTRRRRAAR